MNSLNKKHLSTLFLVILILCSCRNKPPTEKKIVDFQVPVELKGERILQDYFELATIQNFDDVIILTAAMDNFFHVFNKRGKHITSFGQKGRGPGEFVKAPFLTDIYKQNSTTYGVVYDEVLQKAVTIDLTASISEEELIVQNRLDLPSKLHKSSIFNVFYIKEKQYAGMLEDRFYHQINRKRNGFYYDAQKDKLTILPLQNLKIKPNKKFPEVNLNNREARLSPDRSKLAFAMMYYPMVEIFEVGSDKPVQYLLDNPPEGPFKLSAYKENKLTKYFLGLYVSNKYLYVLGSKKNDQEIFVMDWNGNPVNKYLIPDQYDLNWITVDEKNKLIYGISYDQGGVFKFDYGRDKEKLPQK
jgi:hypothetical protein